MQSDFSYLEDLNSVQQSLIFLIKSGGCLDGIKFLVLNNNPRNLSVQNAKDNNKTLLHYALEYYDPATVEFLIEHLPEKVYDLADSEGKTPLLTAIINKRPVANILFEKSTSVTYQLNGKNIFSIAAEHGNVDFLNYYIASLSTPEDLQLYYNSPYFLDEEGNAPTHHAINNNHYAALKVLIDSYRIPLYIRNNMGETVLTRAKKLNQIETVEYLLSKEPNKKNAKLSSKENCEWQLSEQNSIEMKAFSDNKKEVEEVEPISRTTKLPIIVIDSSVLPNINSLNNLQRREIYLTTINNILDQLTDIKKELLQYQRTRSSWKLAYFSLIVLQLLFFIALYTGIELCRLSSVFNKIDWSILLPFVYGCVMKTMAVGASQTYLKSKVILALLYCQDSIKDVQKFSASSFDEQLHHLCHLEHNSCKTFLAEINQFLVSLESNTKDFIGLGIFIIMFAVVLLLINFMALYYAYKNNNFYCFRLDKEETTFPVSYLQDNEKLLLTRLKDYINKVITFQTNPITHGVWQTLFDALDSAVTIQQQIDSIDSAVNHFANERKDLRKSALSGKSLRYYEDSPMFFNVPKEVTPNQTEDTMRYHIYCS